MKKTIIAVLSLLLPTLQCFAVDIQNLAAEAEKIVNKGLENSDARIRAYAIETAASSEQYQFANKISILLNDPVMQVKFAAAIAAGDLNFTPAEAKLTAMLNNTDINIRIAAAYGLCKIGKNRYLPVIRASAKSADATVQANAAMLLGKLKDKESLELLYKLKDNPDSTDTVAFNAVEAIAAIGDNKIYQKIWAMLISAYADDRYMGIQAMAALGGAKGAAALSTMLDDEVLEIKLSAAEKLGKLGDPSGQTVVFDYLSNPDTNQNQDSINYKNALAAMAIGEIGTEKLLPFLPKLLRLNSFTVRLSAAKSVFLLKNHRAKRP